jgi:hypothetical protein
MASSVPCHATVKFSAMAGGGRSVPNKVLLKCFLDVTRRTLGQARDDGPVGEYVGIGCEHCRSHRPTRRQSNYEDAPPVDAVVQDHLLHNLPDREHLAVVALGVKRKKQLNQL